MTNTRTALAVLLTAAAFLTACAGGGSNSDASKTAPVIPAQQFDPAAAPPSGTEATRTPPPTATALPDSAPADLNHEDPDAIAEAALTIWFTWNTATDTGPNDAAARTAPLLTEQYARELTATTALSSPGAQWQEWSQTGALLVPDITADDEPVPPQTESVAYRSYLVAQHIDDDYVGESVVAVILRHGLDGWEVSRVQAK